MNDPSVFRHVAIEGMEELDIGPLLADERNVLLMAEHGGILFCWHEPCVYEVHTNFLKPEHASLSHGRYIRDCSLSAYRWMFLHTDAMILLTRIPAHNKAAERMAPLVGWVKEFERKQCWPSVYDGMQDVNYYAIRYDDWLRSTPELEQSGQAFHANLRKQINALGCFDEQHAEDHWHDRHAGACTEMIKGGQLEKAIILYNRWARFAGYAQIGLVSAHHRMLDIDNAVLQIGHDGEFNVVRVK